MVRIPISHSTTDSVPAFTTHHAPGCGGVHLTTNQEIYLLAAKIAGFLTGSCWILPLGSTGCFERFLGCFSTCSWIVVRGFDFFQIKFLFLY
jgi:hypothetical protein